MTDHPTAPVQDDDAEELRQIASLLRESGHQLGVTMEGNAAFLERIASRLSPTPETGLALQQIDEQLWTTHGSNNVEALIACLKSVENIVRDALSNVLPDEV